MVEVEDQGDWAVNEDDLKKHGFQVDNELRWGFTWIISDLLQVSNVLVGFIAGAKYIANAEHEHYESDLSDLTLESARKETLERFRCDADRDC